MNNNNDNNNFNDDDFDVSILKNNNDDDHYDIQIPLPDPPCAAKTERILKRILKKETKKNSLILPQKIDSLDDIRNIWLSAREPAEIAAEATSMPFAIWIDYAIKLSPKQMKLSGQVDMRAAFMNLGPPHRNRKT